MKSIPKSPRPWRAATAALVISVLACACAPKPLEQRPVPAGSSEAFAEFRTGLAREFAAEQLRTFDTAVQELKLEAMNQGVSGTAAREARMREQVDGRTVQDVRIRGWQARAARLKSELDDMSQRLAEHSKLKPNANNPDAVRYFDNLLRNEQDLVAQLQRDLAAATAQLSEWGAQPSPLPAAGAPGK